MEEEYKTVLKTMKTQVRLWPYNPKQKLKLVIDGARTAGTGFLLIQIINDEKPEDGIKIINAGSCLLLRDRDNSSVEAEAIALDLAMSASGSFIVNKSNWSQTETACWGWLENTLET